MTKRKQTYFLIDFDSTFISDEGLEIFAQVVLRHHKDKQKLLKKITFLTNQAMEGKLSFSESLEQRIQLLSGNKHHIKKVAKLLKEKISLSILQNKTFFQNHKNQIFIISGGFKEFIHPVVRQFGIRQDHVFANTFLYDNKGKILGVDTTNVMSQDSGKVKVVKSLKLKGDLYMIGDGYTDYELKKLGLAKKFIAFTENISRDPIIKHADEIAPTFDEFLYENKLPLSISYPKNRIIVFSLGALPQKIKQQLQKEHYQITERHRKEYAVLKKTAILFLADPSLLNTAMFTFTHRLLVIGIVTSQKLMLPNILAKKGIAVFQGKDITKRIIDFINTGDTYKNLTLPEINLPKHKKTHRLLHIHKNKPGMLAQLTAVMAKNGCNITSQYLQTKGDIGYVITDIDKVYDKKLLKELKQIPHTIRFRVLY